jgi:methionyl aminopeptidase
MIPIKTKEEIEIMAQGGHILAEIMNQLKNEAKIGVATIDLNRLAESLVFKYKCRPSFKNYKGFPETLCTSINEVVVHGVPSDRILKDGDVLSLDLGIFYQGFHSDMAITIPIGKVEPEILRLIKVANKALKRGLRKLKPNIRLGAVGNAIQRYVESQGFNIVKDLCGHGIGRELHEDPEILNYGKRREGDFLKEGMVICLEPMITIGKGEIKKSKDGFAFETKDGSIAAHFEHTVAITQHGSKILTI